MGEPTFALLGPLLVRAPEGPVRLGGPKARAVLATLLLQPTRFVSVDLLTEVLWPRGAPRSAVANIRTYVNALRNAYASAGIGAERLRTESSGYRLDVADDEVDSVAFERLLNDAAALRASGDNRAALDVLERALGLWRGSVLEDLAPNVVWDPVVVRLEELRATAADECLHLRLLLGQDETLIAELRYRLTEDPLREDLWCLLVQALHQGGRTADARSAYAEAGEVLATELGTEPGDALRAAGTAVGAAGNGSRQLRRRGAAAATAPAVCQLPIDVPDFTGREGTVASVERLLRSADRSPVVAVLFGAPGVGKTTLAVHLGHRVRDAFPDAQLYVEMGGMSGAPREPADVLAELLRCLGVADAAVPRDVRERAALFRSRIAGRRILVVLDDAADSAQLRPLLPGTGGSAVLVTTRRRMSDVPGQHHEIGVIAEQDARRLFTAIVGAERVERERPDVDRVVTACGLLPLAVRIAGARLANRPGWTVRDLADSLEAEGQRLNQLRAGGLEVRTSAEPSYRHLPASAATAFRALGQLVNTSLPGWMVAVTAGEAAPAEEDVEALLTENLLSFVGTDRLGQSRYQLHALLHEYAKELAHADPLPDRRARHATQLEALTGLALLANQHMPIRFFGVVGEPGDLPPPVGHVADAVRRDPVAWFEVERRLAVTSVRSAVELDLVPHAAALAVELAGFFDLRGYYRDWSHTHRVVLAAYQGATDRAAAALVRNVGQLHLYQDEYADALAAFEDARQRFRALGDEAGIGVAAVGSGSVHRVLGNLDAALADFTAARQSFESAGDHHGLSVARNATGSVWLERRMPEQAEPWLRAALELSTQVGDRHRQAQVRRRLAVLHDMQGDLEGAQAELKAALETFESLGDAHCAAYVQQAIGELWLRQGRSNVASTLLTDALSMHRRLGDRRAEASVASLLGQLNQATGRSQVARRYLHRSRSIWRQLAQRDQVALVDARLRTLDEGGGG